MDRVLETRLCPLSSLKEGEWAQVRELDPRAPLAERFGDIGLHTDVVLTCVRKSFLGDPIAYGIVGSDTVVAIRKKDADGVLVAVSHDMGGEEPWD